MVSMTMKANLWIIVLVCGCLAKKEELGELSAMLKNPAIKEKLIQEIQKRLEGGIKPECTYKSNSSTIIRTTESLAAGAKFLKNAVVISSEECVFECCQLKTCNVAVFKEKKKPACYLFNCGDQKSKCLFAEDAGFSILMPNNPAPIITSSEQSDKHASDLEKLSPHRPEEVPTTTTTTSTTTTTTVKPTTKKPTTTTTTTTLAPTHREPVPLFGPCHSAKDCAGSSTECLAGYCVCMDGYHAQDGVCRKDCGRFEFECANDGRPLLYPQCIAIYDRCDGIKHCKDSSDEQECPRSTTAPKNGLRPRLNTQRKGPPLHIGKEYQSAGRTHGVGDKDQLPVKPPEGKPEEPDNSQEPSQSQNAGSWQRPGNMGGPPPNPHGKQPLNPRPTLGPHPTAGKLQRPGGHWRKTPSQGQGDVGPNQRPQTPIHQGQEGPIDKDQGQQVGRPGHWRQAGRPMQPSHSRGQHISKLPTDAHGPNAGSDKDPSDIHSGSPKKAVPTSPDAQHVQNKEPKTKTPAVNTDQGKKEPSLRQGNDTAKVEAAGQQQEIDKQEKGQFYAMESNQGAVIALAMGLAVTALLLIFVGCRLRNVKKRLRRGRALHSNEADYLINGMYL